MDQKMIAKNKFAKQQMEVAIDNGQLDRAVRQILRTRSEEMGSLEWKGILNSNWDI